MLTDWELDDGEVAPGGRHVQQIRTRRRNGLKMLEKLRAELSRRRDNGEQFSEAWPASVTTAMRGVSYSGEQRAQWKWALNETRGAWCDAYECQPDEKVKRVAAREEVTATTCNSHTESSLYNIQTGLGIIEGSLSPLTPSTTAGWLVARACLAWLLVRVRGG